MFLTYGASVGLRVGTAVGSLDTETQTIAGIEAAIAGRYPVLSLLTICYFSVRVAICCA